MTYQPSDFDISGVDRLYATLGNREDECVAHRIIGQSQDENKWTPLSISKAQAIGDSMRFSGERVYDPAKSKWFVVDNDKVALSLTDSALEKIHKKYASTPLAVTAGND